MRQVGLLAAAAEYGLDHHLARLSTDHQFARRLAEAIATFDARIIDMDTVQTNIIGLDLSSLSRSSLEIAGQLREAGILSGPLGPKYLRLVTHSDLSSDDIDRATEGILTVLKSAR